MSPRIFLYLAFAGCAQSQAVHFQWVQQIGGSQGQSIAGVGTDSQGNTYVVGNTASLDLPVKGAVQSKPGGSGLFIVAGPGKAQNLFNAGLAGVGVLANDPSNAQGLFASDGQTLERTRDGGATWTAVSSFTTVLSSIAVDPSAPNVLYAATFGGGVFKSTDSGATFTSIDNGIPPSSSDGKFYAYGVWVDPRQSNVVFANTYVGLVRSSDAGASWQVVVPASDLYSSGTVSFDPTTPGVVYLGGVGAVRKSTDDGVTWTALPGPPNQQFYPNFVLPDPSHPGTIYAGGFSGLYKSTDGGNTWVVKLAQTGIYGLKFDANGVIYYATFSAVYASTDGLDTVTQVGPSFASVTTIATVGARLFVGTQGSGDVFVSKLDAQGNVVYATYFGGSALDQAQAMAVDSSGAVYVTGVTGSSDFPVSQNAYAKSGASFLFKLNTDGSLNYSTYFAPVATTPSGLAVDAAGSAYIAGPTQGNLPTTAGAYQTQLKGNAAVCCSIGPSPPPVTNGFLTKFSPDGSSLVFSTYLGSQFLDVNTVGLRPNGEAILTAGNQLFRMSADGGSLLNSGSFAGTIYTLMVDPAGNIFVGGSTLIPHFPVTAGAFQTAVHPGANYNTGAGFVTRFDEQFNVVASTLLAGENGDTTLALASAPNGNVLAAGATSSESFPLRGPAQGAFAAATGFVAELTPDLTSAVFSTFAGDTRKFNVRGVAPTPDGGVVFGGATNNVPYYSLFGLGNNLAPDGSQAFVVKAVLQPAMPRIDSVVNAASQLGVALAPGETFVVGGVGFGDDASLWLNGTQVPLISHSGTSLTAAVPTDLQVSGSVVVTVQSGGNTSNGFLARFLVSSPGIFSADGSGFGQGYILNADGTLNSPNNPAAEGTEITIYATGVGHLSFDNGYAVTDTTPVVAIDSFGAPGIAAVFGPVQGFAGNVYQISVYIPHPADFAADNPNLKDFKMPPTVPVFLTVNGITSQYGLTLSVQ